MASPQRRDPIPLLERFALLAQELEARAVFPQADGALFILVRETEPKAWLRWEPDADHNDPRLDELPGRLHSAQLTPAAVAKLAARLVHAAKKDAFRFLRVAHEAEIPIELNRWFVARHLTHYLEEGISRWGPYRLEPVKEVGDAIELVFSSIDGETPPLHFSISASESDPVEKTGASAAASPLTLRCLAEDSDDASFSRSPERYLRYALARSFVPGQALHRPTDDSGPENETEKPASPYNQGFLAPDHRDYIPMTCFFALKKDPGVMDILSSLSDDGLHLRTLHVGSTACLLAPTVDIRDDRRFVSARFMGSSFKPDPVMDAVEMGEIDVIVGDDASLRRSLETLIDLPDIHAVVLIVQCLADFVGLDLDNIVAEATAAGAPPIIRYTDTPAIQREPYDRFWHEILQLADPNLAPDPKQVNLVGFAPRGSRADRELTADLAALNLTVNARFIPSLKAAEIRRFGSAALNVLFNERITRDEIGAPLDAYAAASGRDILAPVPPIGPDATQTFYRAILTACDLPDDGRVAALWEPFKADWEKGRASAAQHEIAIIVDAHTSRYLREPDELYGIPLPVRLAEMGFALRLVLAEWEDAGSYRDAEFALESLRDTLLQAGADVILDRVAGPDELAARMRDWPASLIFSDFPGDRRIVAAGKTPFSIRAFEFGFAGALRSQRHLLRLAHSGYARAFGPLALSRNEETP